MRAKKRNKKILSLLIATLMIISMLPSSVFAATDDVMIEEYADVVTEEADVVDGVADEAAEVPDVAEQEVEADLAGASEVVSTTAEGLLSGGKMTFDAVLDGVSVSAAVPASRAPQGSVMTVDLVDVADYADAIAAKIYGKDVSALKGLELHFYNKKGKEITHINTSDVTITADAMDADSYALCRLNGNSVGVVKKADASAFTFKEKKAYTYAIVGLADDGVLRATAETGSNGVKSFNLDNIEVIAPEDAFGDDVAMEASDVTGDAATEEEALVGSSEDEVIAAYEISFYDEDGVEQQPEKEVTVKIATALDMSKNYKLIHIADNGETNEVENAVFTESGVEFVADSFSVYAVIEGGEGTAGDQPYRATYEFYNADGSKYFFKDAANRDKFTQILKDGEALEDVGIPTQGASQNAKFVGWFDEEGNRVEIGEKQSVDANKTIKLTAKLKGIVNVMFVTAVMKDDHGEDMERSIVTVKQVEYTVGQEDPITVKTSDVTTEAPTSEQAVVGWNRDELAANAGTVEGTGTDRVITLYANGSVSPIKDVMMYPAIQDAYWLYFNENDGGTGGGASYTPPQFVMVGGSPTRPADPHRTGYTFGGWYKDAACTQEFNFNAVMTATTTVYAKWTGSATTYTVIVWVQRTADSASLPNDGQNRPEAERTYDFFRTYTIESTTGATATANNASQNLGNELDKDGHIKYSRNDGPKEVAANGSTVINVYYDRDIMTIHFKRRESDYTDTYATWYGLYDATFNESNKTWPVITNVQWQSASYGYTFMDGFVDFDTRTATSLTLWQTSQTDTTYHFIFQKESLTEGQYETANSSPRNGYLKLSEKYNGFTLYRYRNGTSGSWSYTDGKYPRVDYQNNDLYIQYSRNSYDLIFQNSVKGTPKDVIRTDSVKYEAPLAAYSIPAAPTYPEAADADHYEFIGWFADSNWTTLVSFTEMTPAQMQQYKDYYGVSSFIFYTSEQDKMPAHNLILYAGYTLKGWDCAINPNGGTLTNENQAGVFWLYYGDTFSSDLKTQIKREGYVFQGWMLADVPLTDDGNLNLLNVTTDANNHRFVGDYSNWTMTDTPWEFSTGISGPTALMAKWFYKTSMKVVYDANGGSDAPTDNGAYSDHATTVAFRAPVPPEGKNFIGWDIQGTNEEEKLQPGATFEVSSDYAVKGVVTLKALYHEFNQEEEVPVSHLTWYANGGKNTNTAGTANSIINKAVTRTDIDLQLNANIDIPAANTFARKGYKFIGWAKQKEPDGAFDGKTNTVDESKYSPVDDLSIWLKLNDDGVSYTEYDEAGNPKEGHDNITKVAVDEILPYQALYAVWEQQYFYIYHSSDCTVEKIPLADTDADGKYDITKKVPVNFMYGGYYMDYSKKGSYDIKNPAEYKSAVDGSATYVGGVGKWKAANVGTAGKGTEMVPKTDETYFLKEVPDGFLSTKIYLIYNHYTTVVKSNYLISDVDDNNYKEIGLYAKDITTGDRIKLAASYTIIDTFNGNRKDKITAKESFGMDAGYVAVWNPALATNDFEIAAAYTTLDGVQVEGNYIRMITVGDGKYKGNFNTGNGGFSIADTDNLRIIKPGNIKKTA